MASIGILPAQLRHIVITHLHADHCASAARLRDLSGATVWMHPADSSLLLRLKTTSEPFDLLDSVMLQAGTPALLRPQVRSAYEKLIALFPVLSPDAFLQDGSTLDSSLGPLEILWTPGHSPGHCCLYSRDARLLFAGDHIIDGISPHIGWLPGHDTLGDYLATLDRLSSLDVHRILPAHGLPFSGLQPWIERTRHHHAARAAQIRQHQLDGVTLADELVRRLWPRELRPLSYHLALTEVLAYLAPPGPSLR